MVHYSPLNPQKSEIRLLTLLPGKPRDEIRCTLSTASLDSDPKFSALSYVWGDPSITKSITVDGEPFDATVNLEAGLRALRKRWKRRVLWIDAICINQNDIPEKNVQVPLMGRLYSTAPKVLVWLGPSTPDIELALSWFRAHIPKSYNTASAYWLMLDVRSALSKRAHQEKTIALFGAIEGFFEFQALPYWSRMWTYQEYLLPRNEPLCFCGNMQPFKIKRGSGFMETEHIVLLCGLWDKASSRFSADRRKMRREESAILMEKIQSQAKRILSPESLAISKDFTHLAILRDDARRTSQSIERQPLGSLLFSTANRQCSNERDKIYALYGMVPAADLQDICPPDYSKPVTDVLLQVVTYMVNYHRESSFIWPLFSLRDDRLSDEARFYPSWMPDFTKPILHDASAANIHGSADMHVAPALRYLFDPSAVTIEHTTLRLWARSLGTCKIVLQFAGTRLSIVEQIIGLLRKGVLGDSFDKMRGRPETRDSRITRTCVAHARALSEISTEEILAILHAINDTSPRALFGSTHASSLGHSLGRSGFSSWGKIERAMDGLRGKALLATEDGCLGIGVGGAKDGDIVVIPPEVGVPLVLTRELANSTCRDDYYKMVGTAIIDGVTSGGAGELFDEEFIETIARRDLLEFLVH